MPTLRTATCISNTVRKCTAPLTQHAGKAFIVLSESCHARARKEAQYPTMSPSGVVGEDERHCVGGLVNGRYIYCSSSQQMGLSFAHAVNMLLGETCTRIDARMCM